MIRRIIEINEEKCNGCGACAKACHEGAIEIVNGKARLMRDDYCDGLGDCLPNCPMEAIKFVEREAAAYDEAAVLKNKEEKKKASGGQGSRPVSMVRNISELKANAVPSQLRQWPVQIKLAPVSADFFAGADLLIAASCSAYAYGDFHNKFIKGKITLIGCPKLDGVDYAEKLAEILYANDIKSITLTRMQVPCCGGLEIAINRAIKASGKNIPFEVVTISNSGEII